MNLGESVVVQGDHGAETLKIGLVTSRFNWEITEKLEQGAFEELRKLGLTEKSLTVVRVPGALEIPLAVKSLFDLGCDGVVALGCVIRGETSHYDFVCRGVERGCSDLALQYSRPVGFGVLTTENEAQALDRVGGAHGHKGAEAAEVTVEMVRLLQVLKRKEFNKTQ